MLGGGLLLRGHGLWYDELYTAAVLDRPLLDVIDLVVAGDAPAAWLPTPPSFNGPYYVVAALWAQLPGAGSATGLRLLSLLAACLAVAVVGRAVALLLGERVALVAGLLAATAPLLLTQAVEARPYGLALLATGVAALGAARWVVGLPRGAVLLAGGGAAAGLLHWFALPALLGLALGVAVTRRTAGPLLVAGAAAVPALVVVAVAVARGAEGGGYLDTTGLAVPWEALQAWTGGLLLGGTALPNPLLPALVAVLLLGLVVDRDASGGGRDGRGGLRWRPLIGGWLLVPVVVVAVADLVRPVYVGRYLLPGLVALAVLAAAAVAHRTRLAVVLLLTALVADVAVLARPAWERADDVTALLLAEQRPGEQVVAVEDRSAAGLAHYAADTRLGADLLLPPDDPRPGADRVWLVRQVRADGSLRPSDDDDVLRGDGLAVRRTWAFDGVKTDLLVQLWTR